MKTGPALKTNFIEPSLESMTDDPVMSPGSMSGVHCTRAVSRVHRLGEGAGEHRLADAGHVLEQHVAVGA